jgi:hypothetical protein
MGEFGDAVATAFIDLDRYRTFKTAWNGLISY